MLPCKAVLKVPCSAFVWLSVNHTCYTCYIRNSIHAVKKKGSLRFKQFI